jgi:hypothetical protein
LRSWLERRRNKGKYGTSSLLARSPRPLPSPPPLAQPARLRGRAPRRRRPQARRGLQEIRHDSEGPAAHRGERGGGGGSRRRRAASAVRRRRGGFFFDQRGKLLFLFFCPSCCLFLFFVRGRGCGRGDLLSLGGVVSGQERARWRRRRRSSGGGKGARLPRRRRRPRVLRQEGRRGEDRGPRCRRCRESGVIKKKTM